MGSHSIYKTKQRDSLIRYFKSLPGVHITATDVCDYFRAQGEPMGQSTVYRQLERLVDEGFINKYIIDGSSPACFEYVGHDHPDHAEVCFHCKCERCGKLIHMHCDEIRDLQLHLYEHHQFRLNPMRTVFYGVCQECLQKETQEEGAGQKDGAEAGEKTRKADTES